jgi:auxin response factor
LKSQRFQNVLQCQEVFHPLRPRCFVDGHMRNAAMYQPDSSYVPGTTYKCPAPEWCDFPLPAKLFFSVASILPIIRSEVSPK